MFKLNIKSGGKRILYKPLSISLKYMIDKKTSKKVFLALKKYFI